MDTASTPIWPILLAAGIPALGAIIAAVVASFAASRAKDAQLASETERDLRRQLAAAKTEVYEPMIEMLRKVMDATKTESKSPLDDKNLIETLSKFVAWVQVYGSDDAVIAYHKFMQQAFHSAPSQVSMYYYSAFLLAVRKELGHPDTHISFVDLLGLRINDIWEVWGETMNLTEEQFLEQADWTPPWPTGYGKS